MTNIESRKNVLLKDVLNLYRYQIERYSIQTYTNSFSVKQKRVIVQRYEYGIMVSNSMGEVRWAKN